jgi:hypothetical protein
MMDYARGRGHDLAASRFEERVEDAEMRAGMLQEILEKGQHGPAPAPIMPASGMTPEVTISPRKGEGNGKRSEAEAAAAADDIAAES